MKTFLFTAFALLVTANIVVAQNASSLQGLTPKLLTCDVLEARLEGDSNIRIYQGNAKLAISNSIHIESDYIEVNETNQTVTAKGVKGLLGRPTIEINDQKLSGQSIVYHYGTKQLTIDNLQVEQ